MSAAQRFVPDPRVEAAIEFGLSLEIDAPWETNGQGQIILNPPIGLAHAKRADRIAVAIRSLLTDWRVWPGVGIHTADGVKAPDLAVAAPDFAEATGSRGFLVRAPKICVETMSPSNTWEEMRHKTLLYLGAGAKEVWVCDESGALYFFDGTGERSASALGTGMTSSVG
jgi:Uma2 family endonuclease